MRVEHVFAPETGVLPDAASAALTRVVARVKPSVVQVRRRDRGNGAGIVWSTGKILTNHHVIAGAGRDVEVALPEGQVRQARVVASNPPLDLALLEVETTSLPTAPIGDSTGLRVGAIVFAVGHPWGQRDVVTAGIVSGLGSVAGPNEQWRAQYIRSDVRLAPGNSGGPLLNAAGEVVGINAMIFGGDLAVAIPTHVAAGWLAGLRGERAYLGASVQPAQLAEGRSGLLVIAVTPDGPAGRAGLLVGDVLLTLAGQPVDNAGSLLAALANQPIGAQVQLGLLRGGVEQTMMVELAAQP
jgi:serine protease Do